MISYDKIEVRKHLTVDNIFELLSEWGGDPEYTSFGIVSATICHNNIGEGSRKLYYYSNTTLFQCYTDCGSFDIFELTMNVFGIQKKIEMDLNDAVRYIATRFGIFINVDKNSLYSGDDWKILNEYDRIDNLELKDYHVTLKEYDATILSRLNYTAKITPWLDEGITQEVIDNALIGYYPGGAQISIPHFDQNNRFIGLRGRALCEAECEQYGKYRPIKINNILYNHPLGMNLYGYNWSKKSISQMKTAIIFESEKSVLKYASMFGWNNNISVACCGSNISMYQMQLLLDAGANEIVVGFDRQFQEIRDKEWGQLTSHLTKLHNRFKNFALISFMFDINKMTGYKDSPIDRGQDIFLKLFEERVLL